MSPQITLPAAVRLPRRLQAPGLRGRTLQLRLALLYAGFFLAAGVAVLLVPILTIKGSTPVGASAAMLAQHNADTRGQVIRAAATLAALVVVAVAAGWLIAGRFLRPLRTITATARDISASNLNRRLALTGRDDEFARLGETLDDLFGRLEASFEAQRRFVASASHELRTPLTAERALLQVALADPGATAHTLRAACDEVLALGHQQERLIDALLTLASSERGIDRWERFDLSDVAGTVIAGRREDAARRGIHVHAALAAAVAAGDPSLVQSMIANLVDNAIRHNPGGGRIEVSTATADGAATVAVSNTGAVIRPEEVDRLFEPFQRLGGNRLQHAGGHGLGLAIVRAIASAHGASLTASARPGGGLRVEVSFPPPPEGAPGPVGA